MVKVVILERNGTISGIDISVRCKNIKSNLSKKIKLKGNGNILEICRWDNNDYDIVIFGWNAGLNVNENKHEIPPPYEDNIYFGDICCCKFDKSNKLINFNVDDYVKFYNNNYGGFDELLSDDSYNDESDYENMSVNSELMREDYSDSDDNNEISKK